MTTNETLSSFSARDIFTATEISIILGVPVKAISCATGRLGWFDASLTDRLADHTLPYAVYMDVRPRSINANWELDERMLNELAGFAYREGIPFHEYEPLDDNL